MRIKYLMLLLLPLGACTSGSNKVLLPNIFGLNGLSIQLSCDAPCNTLNEIRFSGGFKDLPLNDLDSKSKIPEFYQSVLPLRILESLGFETVMIATSKAGKTDDFPIQFEVKASQLEITITDGSGSPTLSKIFSAAGDLSMIYTRQGNCQEEVGLTTCTYNTTASEPLLNLEIKGSDLSTFYNQIWTNNHSPNPLSAKFDITFKGDRFPPSDTEITYTLVSKDGKLEF